MLQVDVCPFASDALEAAMTLAQTKALNSYTFSDCITFLNYTWADIYSKICMIDSGYYSVTVPITKKLTKLPKFVRNSVMIYAAQSPVDSNRQVFRQSGPSDMRSPFTYNISGNDLFCPDAERTKVWLEYCPQPAQIFFTHHNRDPKIFDTVQDTIRNGLFNLYYLVGQKVHIEEGEEVVDLELSNLASKTKTLAEATPEEITDCNRWFLKHRNVLNTEVNDITDNIVREPDDNGQWELKYISCDFPYIFCSYCHNITGEWLSGFFTQSMEWTPFNPFSFSGRNDNVEYVQTKWNDKTGMGVVVKDHNDVKSMLLNTDKLPIGPVAIKVLNKFTYKASDHIAREFTPGYWFNRFENDCQYEQLPVVEVLPAQADLNDFVMLNEKVYRFNGSAWIEFTDIHVVAEEVTSPVYKELGWTPDTKLVYPAPEVYRYLVARLAEKFATLNESNIMGVQAELTDAQFAFNAFLKKDKSAWERMRNVNLPTMTDWL